MTEDTRRSLQISESSGMGGSSYRKIHRGAQNKMEQKKIWWGRSLDVEKDLIIKTHDNHLFLLFRTL